MNTMSFMNNLRDFLKANGKICTVRKYKMGEALEVKNVTQTKREYNVLPGK